MSIYKITNISNTFDKRNPKVDKTVNINYIDGMTPKSINVKSGETIYLKINSLPMSIHKLRIQKLIIVSEISEIEFSNIINDENNKNVDNEIISELDKKLKKENKKFKK